MQLRVFLAIPQKNKELEQLRCIVHKETADLYVFPEGFLHDNSLLEALSLLSDLEGVVVTGWKHQTPEGIFEKAIVIEHGKIVDEYAKCILTQSERQKGKRPGPSIHCVNTHFGRLGIPVCYEIHFPEVSRLMALEQPIMLLNLIGTGMYHQLQLDQWTSLAKARAIENEVFVLGCSHYVGEIPLAFAYSPTGELIGQLTNTTGGLSVVVDTAESFLRPLGYMSDRLPAFFKGLSQK